MIRFVLVLAFSAVGVFLGSLADGGIVNQPKKTWRVAYHRDSPNAKGDVMVRLRVKAGTGTQITGELFRYDGTKGSGATEKYKRMKGKAGKVNLSGSITSPGGGTASKKPERFELYGFYNDEDGNPHLVTLKGYHSVGRDLADPNDDQSCFRYRDKNLISGLALAKTTLFFGDDCDEQPPDEDVLTEENEPADETEEPYDGGT